LNKFRKSHIGGQVNTNEIFDIKELLIIVLRSDNSIMTMFLRVLHLLEIYAEISMNNMIKIIQKG
jgi:hypothetical protein